MAKSFYDVLGVSPHASTEQIRQSYVLLNKMLHPDKFDQTKQNKEWRKANEMLKELNEAYTVLRNPATRADYDQTLARGLTPPSSGSPENPSSGNPSGPFGPHGPFVPKPLKAATIARTMTIIVAVLCLLVLPQTCTRQITVVHPGPPHDTFEQREIPAWGQVFVWAAFWCAATYGIFRGSKSVYE